MPKEIVSYMDYKSLICSKLETFILSKSIGLEVVLAAGNKSDFAG